MMLPDKTLAHLSGSILWGIVEEKAPTPEAKEILASANWYLINTRYGQTTILKKLSTKYKVPQTECSKLIRSVFGDKVFVNRNKAINGNFIQGLKND